MGRMAEIETKKAWNKHEVSTFPWSASGRALAVMWASTGMNKINLQQRYSPT